jgi:hypothetical protein
MWNLESEDDYFRIYDSQKNIAGYFDPDYGEIFPKEKQEEIIQKMLKNHDKISGGFLMVPMVKFGIFDSEYESNIANLESQIVSASARISKWKDLLSKMNNQAHWIHISHTDQDMLSITFPIKFSNPKPLEKNEIIFEIEPILNLMQQQGLL